MPKIDEPKELCTGCLVAKQTRKPFPSQSKFCSKEALELVHGDICGPIAPSTPGGNKYVFLLVDDWSRVMWAYLLKYKDEAFGVFKKFRALVETQDRKIRTFRTDRGGEFMSKDFTLYCEEAGIARHFTAPYSPQQNGVVERRNRTMIEMARSFLKQMNMPNYFWGEAVRHSIYILNRLPTRAITGITPYEAWCGEKPHVEHIKVFGCTAYMKVPGTNVKKLDDRSKAVIYLGKEPGTKAFRLYDLETRKVCVSRDVYFEERKVWDWHQDAQVMKAQACTFTVADSDTLEVSNGSVGGEEIASQGTDEEYEVTDSSGGSSTVPASSESETDSEHRETRSLADIYANTEIVELEDEELFLMGVDEPANYSQAAKDVNWRKAMNQEIESVEKNNTWKLTELPPGRKAIDLKWVYKLKRDAKGEILKYKARIVAKGYVQKRGIDFEEIFAPVTRIETVRLLLALAAKNSWEVHHLDVKTAFLNGEVQEEIYVSQPEGFVKRGNEHLIYKLLKALYGLRQAPRAWYAKLNQCLVDIGFSRCPYEHAVYVKKVAEEVLVIAIYVDDILVTGSNPEMITNFKEQMSSKFDMTDLGKMSYYLGIEVNQGSGYIELRQTGYAKKILEKAGMADCNSTKYPMDPNDHINKDEGGITVDPTQYKSLIGGLRYLVHTRPDIAYSVGIVSRYMEKPTLVHQNAAKRILRYVKGTLGFGLMYTRNSGNNILTGFLTVTWLGTLRTERVRVLWHFT